MDEVERVSLPREIWQWRSKHRSAKDLVGYLWSFSKDGHEERGWTEAHHTDQQCIDGCGMTNVRDLRRGILEGRKAGYLMRAEVDGKPGFKLYWPPQPEITAPECAETPGHTRPVTGDRSQVTGHTRPEKRSHRTADPVTCDRPTTLQPNRPEYPRESDHDHDLRLEPLTAKTPRRRGLTVELAAELLALQNAARNATGARIGKTGLRGTSLTPGIRKAMAARLAEGYTADQLRQAMRARERAANAESFRYLGTASAWSSKAIDFALAIPDDEFAASTVRVVHADGSFDID